MEEKIDEAVDIANAPVLNVVVDEGGMGTASPRGTLSGIKQGVPFSLNYVPKNEYPFYGWQARLESSDDLIAAWTAEGAMGTDTVGWVPQNITGTEVRVTIHINTGEKIIIGPIGANAPELNVEIDEGGMGTASPRGAVSGVKRGIPFQLNYQSNGNYPFYGWQARLEGSDDLIATWTPEGASGADKVSWVPRNIDGTEVQVTIYINPAGKIIIGPIGANAPEINVEIVVTGRGSVTGGNVTGSPIKLGVPFSLNFSPATEYGFIGWRAYRDSIAPGNMLGDADVVFNDRRSLNPELRVNINPEGGKVVIEAYTERLGAVKPVGSGILSANKIPPGNGAFVGPPPQHIQLQFDKPMDARSFIFPDWTASKEESPVDGEGNQIVRFNNIVLTGTTEHNPYDEIPLSAYFNPPVLSVDGKIVTLWVKEKAEWYQPYIDGIYFWPFFGYNL
ncbi:MAG: hypothetical protein LBC57_03070, partial [Treponema sp.]|nr:hypothetical protein [Treponema sp.]